MNNRSLPSKNQNKFKINIDDYKIISLINKGGFGSIYSVQNQQTSEIYAAKILPCNEEKSQCIQMINREVGILMRLQHPTIIKFYGYSFFDFKNEKNVTIIMDLAKNGSLADAIKKSNQGLADSRYDNTIRQIILVGIARGMMHLHEHHVIHRDLKPGNILLDDNYYPHITDFGLSKFYDSDSLVSQSIACGTSIYKAPEVINSNKYNGKSDVYSYGILMYEVITDSMPYPLFQKGRMTEYQFNYKVVQEDYRPQFTVPVKNSLKKLIERCWSKNPTERPTFEEIFNKLAYNIEDSIYDIYEEIQTENQTENDCGENDENLREKSSKYHLDDVDCDQLLFYIDEISKDDKFSNEKKDEILMKSVQELKQTLEKVKIENDELKSKIKLIEKVKNECGELKSKIKAIDKVKKENDELKNKLKAIEKVKGEFDELKNKMKDIEKVKKENDELKSKLETIEKVKIEYDEIKSKFDVIDKVKKENDELKSKLEVIKKVKIEYDEMKNKLDDIDIVKGECDEIINKVAVIDKVKKENDDLKSKMKSIEKVKKENDELKNKIKAVEKDNQQLNSKCKEIENEIDPIKKENENLKSKVGNLEKETDFLRSENEKLKNQVSLIEQFIKEFSKKDEKIEKSPHSKEKKNDVSEKDTKIFSPKSSIIKDDDDDEIGKISPSSDSKEEKKKEKRNSHPKDKVLINLDSKEEEENFINNDLKEKKKRRSYDLRDKKKEDSNFELEKPTISFDPKESKKSSPRKEKKKKESNKNYNYDSEEDKNSISSDSKEKKKLKISNSKEDIKFEDTNNNLEEVKTPKSYSPRSRIKPTITELKEDDSEAEPINKSLELKEKKRPNSTDIKSIDKNNEINVNEITLSSFNKLPLKLQQQTVSDILLNKSDDKQYFTNINNILLYLLKFNPESSDSFHYFEIESDNNEIKFNQITEDLSKILICYDSTELLYKNKSLNSSEIINYLGKIKQKSIEIQYPSDSFKPILDILNIFKIITSVKISLLVKNTDNISSFLMNNNTIDAVRFDSSVSSINDRAFRGSFKLESVLIPSSVTRIGDYAFFNCSNLSEIILPNSLVYIGKNAFSGCCKIKEILIPSSVKTIDDSAFEICASLNKITIPTSIENIGKNAFPQDAIIIKV